MKTMRLGLLMSLLAALGMAQQVGAGPGTAVAWGWDMGGGPMTVPVNLTSGVTAVAAGAWHCVALRQGRVFVWGSQSDVPAAATSGVSAISAGYDFSLALKAGQVLAWGSNPVVVANIPLDARSGVSAIAAGTRHGLALNNGRVMAWGSNLLNQIVVPTAALDGVTAIAASYDNSMALKNGRVIVWGDPFNGQTNVPAVATSGVTAVATGQGFCLALKSGCVIAWGRNTSGVTNVPAEALSGVSGIAASFDSAYALKNGRVLAWGGNGYGETNVPVSVTNVVSLAVGSTGCGCMAITGCYARIYWQNPAGLVAEWTVDEQGHMLYVRMLADVGSVWKLKTVGDLNGDGIEDLLWQRSSDGFFVGWFMNLDGTVRNTVAWGALGSWVPTACADDTGDGQSELFFQTTDGTTVVWYIGPDGTFSNAFVLGAATPWKLKGGGCLHRTDKAALYWQDPGGNVLAWCPGLKSQVINRQPVFTNQVIGATGSWELRAMCDMDGDGVADLLWQTPTGDAAGWFLNRDGSMRSVCGWGNTGTWRLCGASRKR